MTPERWQEVKAALHEVMQLAPGLRTAYLDRISLSDPELRSELESLVASSDHAGTRFLSSPAAHISLAYRSDHLDPLVGRKLGPYQVVAEIGVGGMGEVYRAFRADNEFQQEVAIKLVRGNHDSSFVLRRFRNERQILASLEHPNIARLLDGGTTEDGMPYFVMELVDGRPIDEYCNAQALGTAERLKLFAQVCSAVQYAHQRLIIHRDLKPGNILVTSSGIPKLLDFGIAKILDSGSASDGPEPTLSIFRMLTPKYASPEQVRGETITTASDVYSLGVILYELLTGQSPYRVSSTAPHETARAVCEFGPGKPSLAVRAPKISIHGGVAAPPRLSTSFPLPGNSPDKLRRQLRGDLDNIVLMALRKEPGRRYASVEQLAQDIRRHLEHLPVVARRDTAWYRTTKFVARHKVGAVATAFVVILLFTALAVTIREARIAQAERARAERRFNDVRQLANSLMSEIHDSVATVPGTTAARRLIAQRSLDYLDSLGREAGSDSLLQGELAAAYVKVGDVQGQSYYANLGDTAGALASYRKALAIREALAAAAPGDMANRLELTRCLNKVGEMQAKMGDHSSASSTYKKALSLAESLVAKDPANRENENELFLAYTRMGYLLEDMGDKPAALSSHRQAVIAAQRLLQAYPSDPLACHDLATAYNNVGDLLAKTGSLREGLETYRKGLAVCEWVSADDPQSTQANTRGWLDDYVKIGEMLTQLGNKKEAFESYEKAMHIARRLSAADPQNAQAAGDLSDCYQSFGDSQLAFGEVFAALESYRQAVVIREELSARDAQNAEARANLASSYAKLGQAYVMFASGSGATLPVRVERWRKARGWFEKSLNLWTTMNQNGTLPGNEATSLDEVAKQIARCDAALREVHRSL